MPLAAPIGSGRGLQLRDAIRIIVEQAGVPVVVDAGLGSPSHAAESMELGADAVLVNTAIARAADPVAMARAFRLGVEAGRSGYLAGLMDEQRGGLSLEPARGDDLDTVTVTVNGRPQDVASGESVAGLLALLGLQSRYALVERNGEPVARALYGETLLVTGDVLVVARPVAGG